MRTLNQFLLVGALIFSACEPIQKEETKAVIISPEDKEVLTYLKEVEWPKAYREQDTILLDRILGADFQMIDNSGKWYTKKDELAWIKENATQNDSFWYEIKRMDLLPNGTALICGTGHMINDTVETTYQSSNVLIKRSGLWKAVASHVSGIQTTKE